MVDVFNIVARSEFQLVDFERTRDFFLNGSLHVKDYLGALQDGIPLSCLRYNELSFNRVAVIARVLDYCGLEPHFAEDAPSAFDTDSHQGTVTAHDRKVDSLMAENYLAVMDIFAHPKVDIDPDAKLANSLV